MKNIPGNSMTRKPFGVIKDTNFSISTVDGTSYDFLKSFVE